MPKESISVVIPAYNEEKNIAPLMREVNEVLKKLGAKYEIILVNDGSADNTLLEMLLAKKKDGRIKVIDLRKNFGQSAAMQAGFDSAKNELVCYIDADRQIDFSELSLFLAEIKKGADLVVGWRWRRKDAFLKKAFSGIASAVRGIFIGKSVHDYGCPFKVMRKECANELELYGEMHRYIPPILRWRGYVVKEVKVSHKERIFGKTKYGLARIYKGFLDMLVVWFWQKYSYRPMHIFGGLGLVAIIVSIIFGIALATLRTMDKISLVNSSLPLLTYVIFLTGIILFCFGIISDILIRTYHKTGRKKNYSVKKNY